MPPRETRRRRATPLTVGLGIGAIGCFGLALGLWAASALSQREMAELSPIDGLIEDAELVTEDRDGLPLSDEEAEALAPDPWEGAEERYPGLAAWLEVDGAGISTPVMRASADAPEWFLDHDAFGDESENGLPYLDHRCSADGLLNVVYAHNRGWGSSEGFSSLADAWQQDVFEGIGTLRWADLQPDARTTGAFDEEGSSMEDAAAGTSGVMDYRPICALKVAGDDSDVFDFELDRSDAAAWLDGVLARADAVTSNGRAGGALSDRYLALVTCSGDGYPSQSRTIVLFGDGDEVSFEAYGALLEGMESLARRWGQLDETP